MTRQPHARLLAIRSQLKRARSQTVVHRGCRLLYLLLLLTLMGELLPPHARRVEAADGSIAYGQIASGELTSATQVDRFTFNGVAGDKVYAHVDNFGAGRIEVRLVGPDGSVIQGASGHGDGTDVILHSETLRLRVTGAHQLTVGSRAQRSDAPAIGRYHLFLMGPRAAPEVVPGDIAYGSNVGREIKPGAVHFYAFPGRVADVVSLYVDHDLRGLDFMLFAPDGALLKRQGSEHDLNQGNIKLPLAGRYLIAVAPFYGPGDGRYALRLYGPGMEKLAAPVALGQRVIAAIAAAGGQDLYRLDANASDRVTIAVGNSSLIHRQTGTGRRLQAILFGPDGAKLAESATEHDIKLSPVTAATTGPHIIAIAGQSGSFGRYSLFPSTVLAQALRFNSSVAASPYWVDADGKMAASVVITLRDENGKPLAGKPVLLRSNRGDVDTITQPNSVTDAQGAATGTVTSRTVGEATITARVDPGGHDVLQSSTLNFAPPGQRTGLLPSPDSPYFDRNIVLEPQPITFGVPLTVRVPFATRTRMPCGCGFRSVSVAWGLARGFSRSARSPISCCNRASAPPQR
jgi:hypothetical protein